MVGLKSLSKLDVSASFKRSQKSVAGRADSSIYILAGKELRNEANNYEA